MSYAKMARQVSVRWREGQHQQEQGGDALVPLEHVEIRGNKGEKVPIPSLPTAPTPIHLVGRSDNPIPISPCPACGGRQWRLRSTPSNGGAWLWVCAGCIASDTIVNGASTSQNPQSIPIFPRHNAHMAHYGDPWEKEEEGALVV